VGTLVPNQLHGTGKLADFSECEISFDTFATYGHRANRTGYRFHQGRFAAAVFSNEKSHWMIDNQILPGLNNWQVKWKILAGDYFTADIAALRTALLSMPWVQDASIRRQWPSTIHIRVVEKQPVAYWSNDSLMSDRGELFKPGSINSKMQMPVIMGPDGLHHKVWKFLVMLHTELSGLGLDVQTLVLDERRSWSMLLSNGVEVQLGRNDTEKRLQRFIKVFSMQNAPNIDDIEYIDLRYPNGFAMRGKSGLDQKSAAGLNNISGWNRHA